MTRTEEIYEELKLADRMTPGRTPWQTLLRRAEEMAGDEEQAASEAQQAADVLFAHKDELTAEGWAARRAALDRGDYEFALAGLEA